MSYIQSVFDNEWHARLDEEEKRKEQTDITPWFVVKQWWEDTNGPGFEDLTFDEKMLARKEYDECISIWEV